jgi:hypothetical protein
MFSNVQFTHVLSGSDRTARALHRDPPNGPSTRSAWRRACGLGIRHSHRTSYQCGKQGVSLISLPTYTTRAGSMCCSCKKACSAGRFIVDALHGLNLSSYDSAPDTTGLTSVDSTYHLHPGFHQISERRGCRCDWLRSSHAPLHRPKPGCRSAHRQNRR